MTHLSLEELLIANSVVSLVLHIYGAGHWLEKHAIPEDRKLLILAHIKDKHGKKLGSCDACQAK